ncbi:MAG: YjjG family noncanonical pyrimidine nucleotidase [Bacteroidales bacterium]|nr:YjjG family noncanonical pyrimidine nucleotidase [Bacteroidales bacterium]
MCKKEYKYFLFDLDRTLWDFDKNAKSALFKLVDSQKLPHLFGVSDKEEFFQRYEVINQALWKQYERGEILKEELRCNRFQHTLQQILDTTPAGSLPAHDFTPDELHAFALAFGEKYLEFMAMETGLIPGAEEVLEAVKAKGGKIAIISNGFKGVQYRKMNTTCIHKYVDAVIVSEEVGAMKPSPIIFRKALEAICGEEEYKKSPSLARSRAIMIGDDFANDIEGAQIFGIDQFYYNPYNRPCDGGPTYESNNLADLLEYLQIT